WWSGRTMVAIVSDVLGNLTDYQSRSQARARAAGGIDGLFATQQIGSFAHANQAPGFGSEEGLLGIEPLAVVLHLNVQAFRVRPDSDDDLLYTGVPRHVGQGFLNDPVSGGLGFRMEPFAFYAGVLESD